MPARSADDVVYSPLDTLKPVAEGVFVVDGGPLRAAGIPLPVRMTVVRLSSGDLWLHSPTPHSARLQQELEQLGPIRHLVAPNIAHWTLIRDWQTHVPDALAWAAPGLRDRAAVKRSGVRFDRDLGEPAPPDWAADFDQIPVEGLGITEVAFYHRASRTLILTDLIQNFEAEKVSPLARAAVQLAGSLAPDGKAPLHLRLAIYGKREAAAAAARRLVDLAPERVIFAHGRWFERDGTEALRRSLRWLI